MLLKGLMFGTIAVACAVLAVAVFMWLWNWLMPEIFGLPMLTFWKAFGLLLLAKLIFGFGGGGHKSHWKDKKKGYWRKHMKEKQAGMSPEERAKYRSKMRKCWGYDEEDDPCMDEDTDNSDGEQAKLQS